MTHTDRQIVHAAELYATMQNRLLGYDPAIRKAFIEGAVYALSHQWVSVEERLPENTDYVLVYVPQRILPAYCEVAYWDNEDWYTQDGEHIRPDYWLPIPQLHPEKSN